MPPRLTPEQTPRAPPTQGPSRWAWRARMPTRGARGSRRAPHLAETNPSACVLSSMRGAATDHPVRSASSPTSSPVHSGQGSRPGGFLPHLAVREPMSGQAFRLHLGAIARPRGSDIAPLPDHDRLHEMLMEVVDVLDHPAVQ